MDFEIPNGRAVGVREFYSIESEIDLFDQNESNMVLSRWNIVTDKSLFFSYNNIAREITQIVVRVRWKHTKQPTRAQTVFLRTVRNSFASFLGVLSHNCVNCHKWDSMARTND